MCKDGSFQKSKWNFLLTLFNNNGGQKIRGRDSKIRMKDTFKDKDEDSEVSDQVVLFVRVRVPQERGSEHEGNLERIHRSQSINTYTG